MNIKKIISCATKISVFVCVSIILVLFGCERDNLGSPEQNPYSNPSDTQSKSIQVYISRMDHADGNLESFLTVRNQAGKQIGNLKSSNFYDGMSSLLSGSGYPVNAYRFSDNDSLPGATVLIMDYNCSMYPPEDPVGSVALMEQAALQYAVTKPATDYMEIIRVSWTFEVNIGFTQDNNALINTIYASWPHECGVEGKTGSVLFNAILHAVNELRNIRAMPAIVLMTDGLDQSDKTYEDVLAAVNEYNIPLFSIGLSWAYHDLLQYFADQTFGYYTYYPSTNELNKIINLTKNYINTSYFLQWANPENSVPSDTTICASYQAAAGLLVGCSSSTVTNLT